ncbi:MAG TPA: DUF922 domain-containing protein [Chitinophagaceae bacterium]|nr:DUF922 domain-containing protein [Chitinophagaceae bacterium]
MMPFLTTSAPLLFLLLFLGVPKPALITKAKPVAGIFKTRNDRRADDEYIPWVTTTRLSWDDFLCAPKRNTDAVASTSTALGMAYQIKGGKLFYQVSCKFSKQKSWGLVKTPYILAHEQGHFDITEIFTRKLYQALKGYRLQPATFQKDINAIYEAIVQAKEAFQAAYDGETDHSRNKRKQEEWLERIDTLLEDTQPYANYP